MCDLPFMAATWEKYEDGKDGGTGEPSNSSGLAPDEEEAAASYQGAFGSEEDGCPLADGGGEW